MGVALITGTSRGIGREVATTLIAEGWQVISAVRDPKTAPPNTEVEQVDMGNAASVEALANRLLSRKQKLDALVNNAAIYRGPSRQMWDVNVLGPLRLTRALLPLLNDGARVVMVTSGLGVLSSQPAPIIKRLSDPKLTLDDLERMAHEAPGGYGPSKAAITAMARLFAKQLASRRILVNAISPGWCRTEMGGAGAPLSVEQGAASILWGIRLPPDGPTGSVFEHGRPLE